MTNKENWYPNRNPYIYKTCDPNYEPWLSWEEVASIALKVRNVQRSERSKL